MNIDPSPLPSKNITPGLGCCERIICLFAEQTPATWWLSLVDEDTPLMDWGERIVTAPLDEAGPAIVEAVSSGYRPIVFVSNPMEWPIAYEAAGRYRSFAQFYAFGRNDEAMAYLLSQPSPEILEIHSGQGRLVVPNLEYGKSLDTILEVEPGDYIATQSEKAEPLAPEFSFACRLNPWRRLNVTLWCKSGEVELRQYYLTDDCGEIPCTAPLILAPSSTLSFDKGGKQLLSAYDQGHEIGMLVNQLQLPIEYQAGLVWGEEHPWEKLMNTLRVMLTSAQEGATQYLNTAQQLLLAMVQNEQLNWAPKRTGMVRGAGHREQQHKQPDSRAGTAPQLIASVEPKPADASALTLNLKWLLSFPLKEEPQLEIQINGIEQSVPNVEWASNHSRLTLHDIQLESPDIGWAWDEQNKKLSIRMRTPRH